MKSKHNSFHYEYYILAAICFAIFIPNFGQYLLSPLAMQITEKYHISSGQFANLFTAPMIPAVFLAFLSGILADRFSTRIIIGVALIITTLRSVLSLFATSYEMLFVSFALLGVTASAINGTQAKMLSAWFPVEKLSAKTGIVLSSSTIGMTLALAVASLFPSMHAAFTTTAVLSILATAFWFLIYRDKSAPSATVKKKSDIRIVLQNKYIWITAFCLGFLMAANVVMSSFLPTVLVSRNISSQSAGYYSSIYMIGCFLSCYIAPYAVNKLHSFKGTVFLFSVIGAIGIILSSFSIPTGIPLVLTILITGIGIGANLPLLMSLPVRLRQIGSSHAGTAGGLISTVQLLGAIILPGHILIPLAGEGNYQMLFSLAGMCMLICGMLSCFLPSEKQLDH